MRHSTQDYFGKTVGSVKRVMLTYGPQGRSRGIATIIFSKPGSAADAAKSLNGVKVDNKSMKVGLPPLLVMSHSVLTLYRSKSWSALRAPLPLHRRTSASALRESPTRPKLTRFETNKETISKPKTAAKDKPKAATAATTTKKTATTNGTTKAAATKKKAGRAGRPKAKTAEELDAEMQDYFGGNEVNGAANNGAAAPATNGDAMDDIS